MGARLPAAAGIDLQDVQKIYDGVKALDIALLRVEPRSTLALIGPSGCGKSTLLRLVVGLLTPERGSIRIAGTPMRPETRLELQRRMGYVIQEGGLFPHLTAAENVALVARDLGWPDARIGARIQELLELTQIPRELLDRFPAQISGGQRQRVALMRAPMLDPEGLLLDEPLSSLDPMIRSDLQRDLKQVFGRLRKTVLFVTHDMAEAAFISGEIVYQALRAGDVDAYPEYTGTIAQVILHRSVSTSLSGMRRALSREGIGVSDPLGFNDSYALAVTKNVRERYRLESISDLARHPELKLGLTHEFLGRPDGWPGLVRHYGLSMPHVLGIQHELAYTALERGRIDVTDIYTTDAEIERLRLHVLRDDRGFFPRYDAVWLYRLDLGRREPRAVRAMHRLTGRIDEAAMIRANARVVLGHRSYGDAADSLLAETLPSGQERTPAATNTLWGGILRNTGRHLSLVLISLLLAVLAGIPLGVLAARSPWLGSAILSVTGLLQTI